MNPEPNPLSATPAYLEHAYNNPELSSLGFLRAVKDDLTVPLDLRVKAAAYLLLICGQEPPFQPSLIPMGDKDVTLTIRINSHVEGHA